LRNLKENYSKKAWVSAESYPENSYPYTAPDALDYRRMESRI